MPATNRARRSTNGDWQPTNVAPHSLIVAILFIFLLGIGNFVLHKAVLESRHPVLGQLRWMAHPLAGRPSLAFEFLLLLAALLLVANVDPKWGWAYFGYSALNGLAGWLILSRRV